MEKAIELLQAVQSCVVDDGASDTLRIARLAGLARLLVDLIGTDDASLLKREISRAMQ
jgi:hypothetical protein